MVAAFFLLALLTFSAAINAASNVNLAYEKPVTIGGANGPFPSSGAAAVDGNINTYVGGGVTEPPLTKVTVELGDYYRIKQVKLTPRQDDPHLFLNFRIALLSNTQSVFAVYAGDGKPSAFVYEFCSECDQPESPVANIVEISGPNVQFAEIEVYGEPSVYYPNVALQKPVTTNGNWNAQYAVDGQVQTIVTNTQTGKYVRIDLLDVYKIRNIKLVPRQADPSHFMNIEIKLLDSWSQPILATYAGDMSSLHYFFKFCDDSDSSGDNAPLVRFIEIRNDWTFLEFAEFEARGTFVCSRVDTCGGNGECNPQGQCMCDIGYYPQGICTTYCDDTVTCGGTGHCIANGTCDYTPPEPSDNLAYMKPVADSNHPTASLWSAAVDGDINTYVGGGVYEPALSLVQVELGDYYQIRQIKLVPRQDDPQLFLNLQIALQQSGQTSYILYAGDGTTEAFVFDFCDETDFSDAPIANIIEIRGNNIQFAEIEVYGQAFVYILNVAMNKPVTTNGNPWTATNAVDGLTQTFVSTSPHTNRFVRIDLEAIYQIRNIKLVPRQADPSHFQRIEITLFDSWNQPLFSAFAGDMSSLHYMFKFCEESATNGDEAPLVRFVEIRNDYTYLEFAEFEARGVLVCESVATCGGGQCLPDGSCSP